jgi:hypothetical protein
MKTDAGSKSRWDSILGDTSDTTYEVLHSKLSYISERSLNGNKGRSVIVVKKGIPHTYVDQPPLLSLEAAGFSIPTGLTEMLLASVYKSPLEHGETWTSQSPYNLEQSPF